MSGFEILEALKSNHDLCDIPIIIVSARELSAEETNELNTQIHSIVGKATFNRQKFTSLVDSILVQAL